MAVHDTGSITLAGKQVGRTQPAITHQMHRLERAVGRPLFDGERRHGALTRDGEVLLAYARKLLSLNDEIRDRFGGPDVSGRVRLGVPDLYAAFLLPSVLAGFARVYPQVEIELRCLRSIQLRAALVREEIDLALMTKQPDQEGGVIVREEPLVWVAARDFDLDLRAPLPLALLPSGSLYRQCALDALEQVGRSWTITAVSDSIAGLQAAVHAGLAVSVFPLCAVDGAICRLTTASGLPDLPALRIVLQRKSSDVSSAAEHLAEYILSELGTMGG
ncbi:LysR substrate-binding domain-containing protein [Methylobacterium sp. J-030]|uniref:LysR substrate-binding domain-containing protein n=1 Tax=Methylobacterium sp. J-030 TaxID=2836627 RepID=UPI001FBA62FA|nr:LysR substrate-binding domain-containing protein [Methylobacterium sp. J-030]MCJ2068877.1 LysR substrate-binding domain-containing protein [Methylobacterium sp. J-030]